MAVPVFHQGIWTLLYLQHIQPVAPFSLYPTSPFGIPFIWDLSFWGGVWGLVLVACESLMPRFLIGYLVATAVFGAVFPTLVNWFIVAPLHGHAFGYGWHLNGIITALAVNGAWGLGTGIQLRTACGSH